MRVMHRAARFAYAFVSSNWDQVAALMYLRARRRRMTAGMQATGILRSAAERREGGA
jgi:hypothetical protein